MLNILQRAKNEQLILEMIYLSSKNNITQRKILIQEISGSSIRAYCSLRKQTRIFRLENILSLMPVKGYNQQIS